MTVELLEGLDPLIPLDFFAVRGVLPYVEKRPSSTWMQKQATLPDTSEWLLQEAFARVAVCWSKEALFVHVLVDKPLETAVYPRYREGDSVELFVDTRDLKTTRQVTSFCHHFVFLPQPVQGIWAQEVTHFRTEDRHPLCGSEGLTVETVCHKKSYELRLEISSSSLHGFDADSCARLGLSYRVNRPSGEPQLFSCSEEHFFLEQHPRFWASFTLARENPSS